MLPNQHRCQWASYFIVVPLCVAIGLTSHRCGAQQGPAIPNFAKNVRVRVDGKSSSLADVVEQKSADPKQLAYRNMRVAIGGTPEGQLELALWCRKQKFQDEEQLHWRTLLLMQPGNKQAIKALKLRDYMGQLLTGKEIEQVKIRKEQSEKAAKHWVPKLKRIKQAIEHGEAADRAAAINELKAIRDPAALPFVEEVFSLEDADVGLALVEMAAEMPGEEPAAFLARVAIGSTDQYLREHAAAALQRRPYETYVPFLIARLAAPIELSFDAKLKPGWTQYQKVQWAEYTGRIVPAMYNKIRLRSEYTAADVLFWGLETTPKWGWLATESQPDRLQYDYVLSRDSLDPENPYEYAGSFETGTGEATGKRKGTSIDDIKKKVDEANAAQELLNQRIHAALTTSTGAKVVAPDQQGAPRPQVWWDWWNQQSHRDSYIPSGTEVWTMVGLIPVEQILVGDRVLTRDPGSEDLAFHLVVAMDVQSGKAVRDIEVSSRTILATSDQLFMVSGSGWRKVSELEVGVKLESLAGPQPIEKNNTSEGTTIRYGLAIANEPTLFIDRAGILIHDATLEPR